MLTKVTHATLASHKFQSPSGDSFMLTVYIAVATLVSSFQSPSGDSFMLTARDIGEKENYTVSIP